MHHNQTCRACHRKATETPLPHPPCTLSIQCYELPLGSVSDANLHTYTVCTALSLFKVIIHTSVGASIHSFRDYHNRADSSPSSDDESGTDMMARLWTILGILLCVLILVYLSIVARRAVDEELDDSPVTARDAEETLSFLADGESDVESAHPSRDRQMSEIPFRR